MGEPRKWRTSAVDRTIGENIKHARQMNDWPQYELAQRAGIDNATMSRIESGTIIASVGMVLDMADVLDVPYWWLIEGIQPPIERPESV
jgi:transcriptional regulator with XRE-family HTH domain